MGSPIDRKVTGSQRLTYRSESSEPHIKSPCLRIWHWEKELLEHLALKASGAWAQEINGTAGNGDPALERCTQTFTCTGSQSKAKSPQESGSDLTTVLGGYPGKTGVDCGLWGRALEAKLLGIFISACFSGGSHFGKIWPHPKH